MERIEGNDLMVQFTEPKGSWDITNFLAELNKNGAALPSRYEVLIIPHKLHPDRNFARDVSMRVESIEMPGRAVNTSLDANRYGIAPQIVDGITFGGIINLTVQTSRDLRERVFFQSWQELSWNTATWNVGYYEDYIGTIEIYLLDINNIRQYGVKINECYPKEVTAVSLSYTQATDIIKTSITMQYKYWETLDITNQPANTMENVVDMNPQGASRALRGNIPFSVSHDSGE